MWIKTIILYLVPTLGFYFSSIGFIPNVVDTNVYIHKKVTISSLLHLFDEILLIINDAP